MKIRLPDDVRYIIGKLNENGFEAYAVGGCVRDSILHRVPGDWDITTSARPPEVKRIFRRTIDTGIQHGTVTVMMNHTGYEVTTYRVDGEYEDSRHPKSVEFTSCLKEDLKRRDFTINAMAYNDEAGIIDEFGGVEDLKKGIIRCVGDPLERFTEDALRMLRAVRFSAQLGFKIEENTCSAVEKLAGTIGKISQERIHTELGKTLLSVNPDFVHKAYELGITAVVFPEYDRISDKEIIGRLLRKLPTELPMRYAALLCEEKGSAAGKTMRRLKLDNDTVGRVTYLVENHGMKLSEDERTVRTAAARIGSERLRDILLFEKLFYETENNDEAAKSAETEMKILEKILERGDCISTKELAIGGKDLIDMGIRPGTEIGRILGICLDEVIKDPEKNKREILLKIAGKQQDSGNF